MILGWEEELRLVPLLIERIGSGQCRNLFLLELQRATPVNLKPDNSRRDVLSWVDDPWACFSVHNAWESIHSRGPKVSWHKRVWFNKPIPRHAMILWLAIHMVYIPRAF